MSLDGRPTRRQMSGNDIPLEIWRKGRSVFEAGEAQEAARVGEIMWGTKGDEGVGSRPGELGDGVQAAALDAAKTRRSARRGRASVIGSAIRAGCHATSRFAPSPL